MLPCLLLLLPLASCSPSLLQEPPPCHPCHLLVLVHSAPSHFSLRQALRETWARQQPGKIRTVFVLGEVEDTALAAQLQEEGRVQGDLLQGAFLDSYRNLTVKHLLGLTWARDHCSEASWLLKTDDDQFVDTLHLPRLLQELELEPQQELFLCQVLDRSPERDPASKWYVSQETFPGTSYPTYCGGWAYVSTLPTVNTLLRAARNLPEFWIDDLYVTGLLPESLGSSIPYYDWSFSFLNFHHQFRPGVEEGDFYTPELMVCGDVGEEVIRHVWHKAQKCQDRGCLSLLYGDRGARQGFLPKRVQARRGARQEL